MNSHDDFFEHKFISIMTSYAQEHKLTKDEANSFR